MFMLMRKLALCFSALAAMAAYAEYQDPMILPKSSRKPVVKPAAEVKSVKSARSAKPEIKREKTAFKLPTPIFSEEKVKEPKTVSAAKELETARALFSSGEFARAAKVYESIPQNANEFLRSREELAWSYLQAGDWGRLRGILPHLNSALVPLRWRLEGRVLSAMMQLKDCQYTSVKQEIQSFQNEVGTIAGKVDRKVSGGANAEYWRSLKGEIEEAIFKMRFVKMELRSRLVMLSRDQAIAGRAEKEPAVKLASTAQTYPVNGDVWADELFKVRGNGDSACASLHSAKVIQ